MALNRLITAVSTAAVDLTAEGTAGWVAWQNGDTGVTPSQAMSGGASITASIYGGGGSGGYSADARTKSWSNGTPTGSSSNTQGRYITGGAGTGYEVVFPADTTLRRARMHLVAYSGTARITSILSDASASDQSNSSTFVAAFDVDSYGYADVFYAAASSSQTLTIRVELLSDAGSGNVALFAASLITLPPVYLVAVGAYTSGTGNISPAMPAGHIANDYALCIAHSAGGENIVLGTANSFAELTNSPSATGTTTSGVKVAAFGKVCAGSSESGPTITDPGNHCGGLILVFAGADTTTPVAVTAAAQKASASTSASAPTVTTPVNDCTVLNIIGRDNDAAGAAFSAWANGSLSSLLEIFDGGTASGNGGGLGILQSFLATAGATGSTTATVTSSINASFTLALQPPTGGGGGTPWVPAYLQMLRNNQ